MHFSQLAFQNRKYEIRYETTFTGFYRIVGTVIWDSRVGAGPESLTTRNLDVGEERPSQQEFISA